mgnify:CR=1 FL=1
MAIISSSQLTKKAGSYFAGILESELSKKAAAYKRLTASRYKSIDQDTILTRITGSDSFLVSAKLDGHFYILYFDQSGECVLANPSGKTRIGLPLQKEAVQLLQKAGIQSVVLAGELYLSGKRRTRAFEATRLMESPSSEEELNQLRFGVFDISELNGNRYFQSPKEIFNLLQNWLGNGELIHPISQREVNSRKDIESLFREIVLDAGFEGLVVKSSDSPIYKIKPRHTLDAVVVGYCEGEDDSADMVKDLLLALVKEDDSFLLIGKTGGGFTDKIRRELLTELQPLVVDSEYIEISDSHTAFHLVKPTRIIELSFLDLITENSSGQPVLRANLKYSPEKGYLMQGKVPSVGIISPIFERFRDDKQVNSFDLRIQQITEFVELPEFTSVAASQIKSVIQQRRVFVKETKGQKAVRKFVILKTNKESDPNYPPYVFLYTDFSPGRKEMMDQEIRVSYDYNQILAIYEEYLKENVKKGWNEVKIQ